MSVNQQNAGVIARPMMWRRSFLSGAGAAAAVCACPIVFAQTATAIGGPWDLPELRREDLAALLHKLLVTNSPELERFAVEVYSICVLGKLLAPDPPLAHAWIVPGGHYHAQWLWDTMFVADLLAVLPRQEAIIRGLFQNYWDFQQRWNAAMPDYMHDMISNWIAEDVPRIVESRARRLG